MSKEPPFPKYLVLAALGTEIIAFRKANSKEHAESVALEMIGTTALSPTKSENVPIMQVFFAEVTGASYMETKFKWQN